MEEFRYIGLVLCQCPQAGLFISTLLIRNTVKVLIVSMPSSGLIHFYTMKNYETVNIHLCQCPQAGLFISTKTHQRRWTLGNCVNALKRAYSFLQKTNGSAVFVTLCVNALKRAYSFLPLMDTTMLKTSVVSMPSSGLIHFYCWQWLSVWVPGMCQCPQAGLFISTKKCYLRYSKLLTVSMPSSGLIHFYEVAMNPWSSAHKCVNALKRAYSFLQRWRAEKSTSVNVSMPSSGLIHFYKVMGSYINPSTYCVNALKRAYSFLQICEWFSEEHLGSVNALKRAYSFLLYL